MFEGGYLKFNKILSFTPLVSNDKRKRIGTKRYIEEVILKSDLTSPVTKELFQINVGYCIRTRKEILYNPLRPIEYSEFKNSSGGINSRFGKYCHRCGEASETNIDMPFCKAHMYLLETKGD